MAAWLSLGKQQLHDGKTILSFLNEQNRSVLRKRCLSVHLHHQQQHHITRNFHSILRQERSFLLFCLSTFGWVPERCACGICVLDPHKPKDKHKDKEHRHKDHKKDKERDKVKHNNR